MTKLLVILLILIVVICLIALRYRKQIQAALQIWQMYRKMKSGANPQQQTASKPKLEKNEALVCCARCGKWIAPSEAVKLGGNTIYCSTKCMEKAARLQSLVDRK